MTSKNYNYLLNTENFVPVYDLVDKLARTVQENQEIVGRLTKIVDLQLQYPDVSKLQERKDHETVSETISDENGAEFNFHSDSSASIGQNDQIAPDTLRGFLDSTLDINQVPYDEKAFSEIANPRLRQLLIDNFRLFRLRQMKAQANKEYLAIYQKYEQILTQVVVPKLTEDVSRQNVQNVVQLRALCVDEKYPAEDKVWAAYKEYLEVLEQMKRVTAVLVDISTHHLQAADVERLAVQLQIVGRLQEYARQGLSHRPPSSRVEESSRIGESSRVGESS